MNVDTRVLRNHALTIAAMLLIVSQVGWWTNRVAFLAAWLAAWCFCVGIVMGGLVNVWIHALTGGAWGEALRIPVVRLARLLPWLSLLFLPILLGLSDLYPWAAAAASDSARWGNELSAPEFKDAWLQPGFFAVRAVLILLLWNILAWATLRIEAEPRLHKRRPYIGATALALYSLSLCVAAADWIMSLMPLWYSSSFGLLFGIGQVLAGMACVIVLVCRAAAGIGIGAGAAAGNGGTQTTPSSVRRDLGNLLLSYVLLWAYIAFTQFLIIWAENLPHEIAWYVARRNGVWLTLAIVLAVGHFALPLLLLLFRAVKDSVKWLRWVAAGLLAMHMLDLWWLVLPSVATRLNWHQLLWLLPLISGGFMFLGWGLLAHSPATLNAQRKVPHV